MDSWREVEDLREEFLVSIDERIPPKSSKASNEIFSVTTWKTDVYFCSYEEQ
jgi:hypothetical protein